MLFSGGVSGRFAGLVTFDDVIGGRLLNLGELSKSAVAVAEVLADSMISS